MNHIEWKAEVTKQLTLRKMSRAQLAEKLDYSENYIQHIICGDMRARKVIKAISDELGIEPYSE